MSHDSALLRFFILLLLVSCDLVAALPSPWGGVHKREEGPIYLDSSWGVLDILVPLLGSEVINIEERRPGRHYIINCTVQIIFRYLGDALPIFKPHGKRGVNSPTPCGF